MPQVELSIRRTNSTVANVSAWYLPGDLPERWLHEISLWPVDHTKTRIVVIRDESDLQTAGALAIPPIGEFKATGYGIPYQRMRENIYLPRDGEIVPSLLDTEASELFSSDYTYIWIPGRGLTAAEQEQVYSLNELILLPPHMRTNWDRAVPGLALPNRLVAILPHQTISADDVISDGRDDIGDRATEITKLPKAPKEPMSGIVGAAGRAAVVGAALPIKGLAKFVSAVGNLIPRGGSTSGRPTRSAAKSSGIPLLSGIEDLANRLTGRVSQAIDDLRHKEIGRLLHMLDSDPDQGLRFAIPFGGGEHRGLAAPGSRLGMRNVNFSLRGLGGGGVADLWDMSWEYQQKLLAKYRELAARETRLGRHRRAAYVYAELLGDINSAASTLEEGGYFREAAVLYRDRINNAQAAAECLERGGLWNEAIEAYRDLGRHEKVGDLLTQIEQHDAALNAYHTAAKELLDQSDLLEASRIYEEKIRNVNLAIETLDSGWPNSPQAKLCIRAGFALRARIGFHHSAKDLIKSLYLDANNLSRHAEVAELLAEVHAQYTETSVCQQAASVSRQIIVDRIKLANRLDAERLVKVLAKLSPNDRLLQRDGRRFIDERFLKRATLAPVQQYLSSRSPKKLQLVDQFQLDLGGVWSAATTISDTVFAAGILDNRIVLASCDKDGNVSQNLTPWPKTPIASDASLILLGNRSPLHLFASGAQPLPTSKIFTIGEEQGAPYSVSAGTPSGHGVVWGVASGSLGQTWAVENRDDPALVCIGLTGTIVSSLSLLSASDAPWDFAITPLPMHATNDRVLIGVGSVLLSVKDGNIEELERFPSRITSISGGQPYAAPTVTISLEAGAVLLRYGFEGYVRPFATEILAPLTLLNQGNFAIAADETRIEVYECGSRKMKGLELRLRGEVEHRTGQPVAILPTQHTDRFIVVTSSGTISTYSM